MVSLPQLALVFLKIGGLGFGGPYALLTLMQREVVDRRHWLTADEFAQSVAVGTLTPGPIFFAAAVFVGHRLRGIKGAAVCAVASLLPSFVVAVAFAAFYLGVRQWPIVQSVTKGISFGVVGLLAAAALKTGRALVTGKADLLIVFVAFLVLAVLKVHPLLLIVAAGAAGAFLYRSQPSSPTGKEGR